MSLPVISQNGPDTTSSTPKPADIVPDPHVRDLSTTTDPLELLEEARSLSSVSDAPTRSVGTSDLARKLYKRSPAPCQSSSKHGSGTFGDYMKARDRGMRMGALDESERVRPGPTREPHAAQEPEPLPYLPALGAALTPQQHVQFVSPQNFGLKMPKMKDPDWSGFLKFSGEEIYAGVGIDFLAWGKKFVQRVVAAQLMSGGD
ncbi:hypothetical protein PHMEG_00026705 [Phytophthora megakarya]|uniref:Uncharacterized protein n=1 Tax=Phytophthora megakarya TaxID=4795 RepID=A0A225VBJ5_9STRA|nr:hypothetical protein PHMEG_00026705 [Phytophthora megakarya]